MTSILPPVRANLQERYLFNFRMPADVFKRLVPVPWLPPQLVNNYAIISFCTLQLHQITVAPLPTVVGLSSLSCAYRYAVLDASKPTPTPAVFVPARYTNNVVGSWFTYMGFCAPHPLVNAHLTKQNTDVAITVMHPNDTLLFRATVQPATACRSELFDTADAFAQFIKAGVNSYGTSIRGTRLAKVDLEKTDTSFEPLRVDTWQDTMLNAYADQGIVLDSAFRTAGGRYEWTYHGLTPAEQPRAVQTPVASRI